MKTLLALLLALALLIAAAGIFLVAYGREKTWALIGGSPQSQLFDLENLTRSTKPHDGLLCTPGACPVSVKSDGDLPAFDMTPDALINLIDEKLRQSGLRMQRLDDGSDPAARRYVTWTDTMRFPDINQFWAVTLADGKTGLVAYARAQVGYSDGGNNLKRLRELTADLKN